MSTALENPGDLLSLDPAVRPPCLPGLNDHAVPPKPPQGYQDSIAAILAREPALSALAPLNVLDCGIGLGHLSAALARQGRNGTHITGLETIPMLQQAARQRFAKLGVTTIVHGGEVTALDFAPAQFDVAISAHQLQHTALPLRQLVHMLRVLRPGGLAIVAVPRRTLVTAFAQLMWRVRTFSPLAACQMLSRSGFTNVRPVPPLGSALFRATTLICTARKPLAPHQGDAAFLTGDT